MPKREIDADELHVLSVLSEAAATETGWKRGGVRGWLLGSEVNDRTHSSAAYNLQRLRDLGLTTGETVPDPGRPRRPLVLWRITQQGEDQAAAKAGRDAGRIAEPVADPQDEGVVFITHDAWRCLSVLQGRSGLVAWSALVEEVRKRFRRGLYHEDAKLVVARGLAEEIVEGSGRDRVVSLTATPLGRTTLLVDGKASESLVQVRIGSNPGSK
jgi:DNA-binding PadR family transcriptional regulator